MAEFLIHVLRFVHMRAYFHNDLARTSRNNGKRRPDVAAAARNLANRKSKTLDGAGGTPPTPETGLRSRHSGRLRLMLRLETRRRRSTYDPAANGNAAAPVADRRNVADKRNGWLPPAPRHRWRVQVARPWTGKRVKQPEGEDLLRVQLHRSQSELHRSQNDRVALEAEMRRLRYMAEEAEELREELAKAQDELRKLKGRGWNE